MEDILGTPEQHLPEGCSVLQATAASVNALHAQENLLVEWPSAKSL